MFKKYYKKIQFVLIIIKFWEFSLKFQINKKFIVFYFTKIYQTKKQYIFLMQIFFSTKEQKKLKFIYLAHFNFLIFF